MLSPEIVTTTAKVMARNGAIGYGTALLAGRSRVLVPFVFFIDIILPAALWPWDRLRFLTEISTRNISWAVKVAGA